MGPIHQLQTAAAQVAYGSLVEIQSLCRSMRQQSQRGAIHGGLGCPATPLTGWVGLKTTPKCDSWSSNFFVPTFVPT